MFTSPENFIQLAVYINYSSISRKWQEYIETILFALKFCAAVIKDKKNPSEIVDFRGILVRVERFERSAS